MTHEKRDFEQYTIQKSFWILICAFAAIVLVNVFSYYINVSIGEFQAASQNLSERIRGMTISSNLLFIEIISGASDKDLNEVWQKMEQIQDDIKKIGNSELETKMNDTLLVYKGAMLELNTTLNDATKKNMLESRHADYYKAYSCLNEVTSEIDPHLKHITQSRIGTMKLLYAVLSLIIVGLLVFAGWKVRSFVSMISAMEESNRGQNKLLSTVVNSMASILIFTDSNQIITLWNSSAEKYFGIPISKAQGANIFETLPFMTQYATDYHKCMQLQKIEEFRSLKFSVSEMERIIDIKLIPASGENGILVAIDDVTDLEINKKQTENAQRLETVRNLMKNLLNDFNNIFSMLDNTLKTIEQSVDISNQEESAEMANIIASIRSASEKAQDKVSKLVSMAKEKEFTPTKVELNSIINKALDVCQDIFDKNIQINRTLYDSRAFTVADSELIDTVFFNMLENAADALTIMRPEGQLQGGIVEVSLEKIYPDRNYRQIHPQAVASSYWVINIADNGVGMDSSVSSKVFDPFFSTKGKFGAAGVGLSVADEIIRRHRGFIELYSVPNQGTSFSVFIPETV